MCKFTQIYASLRKSAQVWFGWVGWVWFGVVWFGLMWCGLVWFDVVWFGHLSRCDAEVARTLL